jgi:hypothetical protein
VGGFVRRRANYQKSWHLIAERLSKNGVIPNIITNGWLFDQEILSQEISSGVGTSPSVLMACRKPTTLYAGRVHTEKTMQAIELCRRGNNGRDSHNHCK